RFHPGLPSGGFLVGPFSISLTWSHSHAASSSGKPSQGSSHSSCGPMSVRLLPSKETCIPPKGPTEAMGSSNFNLGPNQIVVRFAAADGAVLVAVHQDLGGAGP